ncbi:related to Casein kinase II subunit beta' [Saccharomycodes ludwigii]|uniref:Casein kinase II subunit beta n=1 Tax=Saccharomycodes ludwigii TaxID=36035 RepID=A0A376B670_9ASCO|nr:hypothetical protein SCDLUD_003179 [Saccharomycodes ludwigii]KAH3900208.1 hypothetical protein SCDLUD_003179 [Saccharomycodes ludwigii]SSD60178.1 related to Casein kinase II subunit beta' [Saccharomycodes ludwigii]
MASQTKNQDNSLVKESNNTKVIAKNKASSISSKKNVTQEDIRMNDEEDDDDDDDDDDDNDDDDESDYVEQWIDTFLGKKSHEYFCDIDTDYITDRFNLINLHKFVSCRFSTVIQYIIDELGESTLERMSTKELELLEADANKLYGLIHARYVITIKGLEKMYTKYKDADFGRCPRVFCNYQPLLPIGLHDQPDMDYVKLYCPSCEDLYTPKSSRHSTIDGAFFGTSFPGMFLQQYPQLVPKHPIDNYVPKIFGFELHKHAQLARWQELQRLKHISHLENDLNINVTDDRCYGGYKLQKYKPVKYYENGNSNNNDGNKRR